MKNSKQILVVRKDLNMRKGKIAAQCCHGSMAFLTKESTVEWFHGGFENASYFFKKYIPSDGYPQVIRHWLENSFRKICVYVNSEEELVEIHEKALAAGLISHLVEDNGATEFNGVKTRTVAVIGPAWDEDFVGITDHLPLL